MCRECLERDLEKAVSKRVGQHKTKQGDEMKTPEQKLIDLLKRVTEKEPASRREISVVTGLSDRKNRRIISGLQLAGSPIVSIRKGYFWARRKEQIAQYKAREWRRVKSIAERLRGLAPEIKRAIDQLNFKFERGTE